MFFYTVLTLISTTSGLWSTGNTHKYHQIDVYIYQCAFRILKLFIILVFLNLVFNTPLLLIIFTKCVALYLSQSRNHTIRVKSGIFGQTAKFGLRPRLFHISNIGIQNKLTKQTVKILMRRLIRSRLIWIYTICKCVSEFTWCPNLPDFTLIFSSCFCRLNTFDCGENLQPESFAHLGCTSTGFRWFDDFLLPTGAFPELNATKLCSIDDSFVCKQITFLPLELGTAPCADLEGAWTPL